MHDIVIGRTHDWRDMVKAVPMALATDCKSLFDLCKNEGKLPSERRVALDLLDVREGLEEFGDQFRWIPTDHMLADCLTKRMPPDLLLKFLKDNIYSLKYDDQITYTKRFAAKQRSEARRARKSVVEATKQASKAVRLHA